MNFSSQKKEPQKNIVKDLKKIIGDVNSQKHEPKFSNKKTDIECAKRVLSHVIDLVICKIEDT